MPSPEDFVKDFLLHFVDPGYSPQQAHEYYLRNRELKGRQAALQKPSSLSRTKNVLPVKILKKGAKSPVLISVNRQQAVDGRVAGLQKRLATLETVLKGLLEKAAKKSKSKDTNSGTPKQTSKQDAAASKSSDKYYNKNKAEISRKAKEENKKSPDSNMSIEEVKAKIAQIRAQLKAALASARQNSSKSQTVKSR